MAFLSGGVFTDTIASSQTDLTLVYDPRVKSQHWLKLTVGNETQLKCWQTYSSRQLGSTPPLPKNRREREESTMYVLKFSLYLTPCCSSLLGGLG